VHAEKLNWQVIAVLNKGLGEDRIGYGRKGLGKEKKDQKDRQQYDYNVDLQNYGLNERGSKRCVLWWLKYEKQGWLRLHRLFH